MPFLTKGKTNWKFILTVLVLVILVGGGILGYLKYFEKEMIFLSKFPEMKNPEKEREIEKVAEEKETKPEEKCIGIKDPDKQTECYTELAKSTKSEIYCSMIGSKNELSDKRANCFIQLAILENTPFLCEVAENNAKNAAIVTPCWEHFGLTYDVNGWFIYRNDEYGFQIKYPKNFFYRVLPEIVVKDCNYDEFLSKLCLTPKIVNNIPSCWEKGEPEGAAGSTYFDWTLNGFKDGKCYRLRFVIRLTNCGVLGSPGDKPYEDCKYFNTITVPKTLEQIPYTFQILK